MSDARHSYPDHHRYGPPVPVRTPRRPRRPQRGQLLGRPGPPHHLRHPIERAKAGRRRHELRRPATSNDHRPSQSDHVAGRTECTLHPDSPTHALPVPGGLPPVHLWTPPAIAGAGGAHRWTAGPGPGPWTAQRRRGSSVAAYAAARPDHRPSQSDHATGRTQSAPHPDSPTHRAQPSRGPSPLDCLELSLELGEVSPTGRGLADRTNEAALRPDHACERLGTTHGRTVGPLESHGLESGEVSLVGSCGLLAHRLERSTTLINE